ncbi:MAG TPA: SDR family oxidoreductase [Hyphomicrobium sp.]|nr:SDR family oxidoreductase [Hyphomicrobium sp.]
MTTVLVIGASRGIGLATVRALLAAGHSVRALARGASRIPIEDQRLEKLDGDALDRATIDRALAGTDAVIQSLGVAFTFDALLKGTTLFSKATRILADAMRANGVRRLVVVTGLGAGDSRGHGGFLYDAVLFPLLLKCVYDDKDVAEQIVRASSLDWTIVRPGLLTNGPATGTYQVLVEPTSWRAGTISRADVADFLAKQVSDRTYFGKTPELVS